ncbi:hypothetical protein PCANC_17598 [Puccinia coronata f. sp. avenae]|uniref:Uncharacterized protein n=1 Tax=Puccinia coronata f. sp. avenae TaxID=200324 RepID=A0A2N5VN20_9BASI|nr:hypothetical protein PCANC_17598 [Puccinia coronata f. sp. avenae]
MDPTVYIHHNRNSVDCHQRDIRTPASQLLVALLPTALMLAEPSSLLPEAAGSAHSESVRDPPLKRGSHPPGSFPLKRA